MLVVFTMQDPKPTAKHWGVIRCWLSVRREECVVQVAAFVAEPKRGFAPDRRCDQTWGR